MSGVGEHEEERVRIVVVVMADEDYVIHEQWPALAVTDDGEFALVVWVSPEAAGDENVALSLGLAANGRRRYYIL